MKCKKDENVSAKETGSEQKAVNTVVQTTATDNALPMAKCAVHAARPTTLR